MTAPTSGPEKAKYAAALKAMDYVEPGMKIGLGTGSTAFHFVNLMGERVAAGDNFKCVPTSSRTAEQAKSLNIPLITLDKAKRLDLVVDGADEFDPDMNLIKGAGGALLQEKLVAMAAKKMIVISDESKEVQQLGKFTLPVEVVQFGWEGTLKRVERQLKRVGLEGKTITRRLDGKKPYVTDEGHYLLDLQLDVIEDPAKLARQLKQIVGVVETGLFIKIADTVIVGYENGTTKVIG